MVEPTGAELEQKSKKLEFIVVILLGITAVATAWSSWQGSMHGSVMSQNYTKSNNLNSEANSEYNAGVQKMSQDMLTWNQLSGLYIDLEFARTRGNYAEVEKLQWKIDQIMADNVSEAFEAAIERAEEKEGYATPFEDEEFLASYTVEANELFAQADEAMKKGDEANTNGDNQGLVSVIYSIVLFLLGINATLSQYKTKYYLMIAACVGFVIATVFMFTIPLTFP